MSFAQSLSGLYGSSIGLDVIGNNLANASTVGFKTGRTEFADIFSSYVKTEPGGGAYAPVVETQFRQGGMDATNNPLDFAIKGDGFFVISGQSDKATDVVFTRNGQFHFLPVSAVNSSQSTTNANAATNAVDYGEKFVVNANEEFLMGWAAGVDSKATDASPLKIPHLMAAAKTDKSSMALNLDDRTEVVPAGTVFDPADPKTFSWSANQQVFSGIDGDENRHELKLYFAKTDTNTWNAYTQIDSGPVSEAHELKFSGNGVLLSGAAFSASGSVTSKASKVDPVTGATTTTSEVVPLEIAVDLAGSIQYATASEQMNVSQNGNATGYLQTMSMTPGGTLVGSFSNGLNQDLATVALATFTNNQGLQSLGGNAWKQSIASGEPKIGEANKEGKGAVVSNFVESSTVDISAELLDMITMQRNYQANAKMIQAQDEILKTLAGLR